MLKRTIFLTSPLRVNVRLGQLVLNSLDDDSKKTTVPIDDLGCVIIENQRIAMTIPALNELINQNVTVVVCNDRGLPNAIINPLECNTLQGQRYRTQLEATLPSKKAIWQQIVASKIKNQSELLNRLGKDGNVLTPYWKNVKS